MPPIPLRSHVPMEEPAPDINSAGSTHKTSSTSSNDPNTSSPPHTNVTTSPVRRQHSLSISSLKHLFTKTTIREGDHQIASPILEKSQLQSNPPICSAVYPTSAAMTATSKPATSKPATSKNKSQFIPLAGNADYKTVSALKSPESSTATTSVPLTPQIEHSVMYNNTRIYENGAHVHVLKPIKVVERAAGGRIFSGLLKRNSTGASGAAFSLLPENNRLDLQRRLSIHSKINESMNENETEFDENNDSGNTDDSDAYETNSDNDFDDADVPVKFKSVIGNAELDLINKLVDKIFKDEDPSLNINQKTLIEKYGKPQGIIGKGSHGVVKLVSRTGEHDNEKLYAVKELKKKPKEEMQHFAQRLTSEFVVSNSLQNLNIVRVVDLMKDSVGVYSEVMEYCSAGDLYHIIAKTNREGLHYIEADCYMKQMLRGIHYMHERGVAHCDLKPENLLLTVNGVIKISDFGSCAVFRTSWENDVHYSAGICGSEPYAAPEIFSQDEYDPRPVDIWSAGVVYLAMATGSYVWDVAKEDDDLFTSYLKHRSDKSFMPIENLGHGDDHKSRISTLYSMLNPAPKERLTIQAVLHSPWIQNFRLCDAAKT